MGGSAAVLPEGREQRARGLTVAQRGRSAVRERAAIGERRSRARSWTPERRRDSRATRTSTAPSRTGWASFELTQRDGIARARAVAYLHPAMARANLTVMARHACAAGAVRGDARGRRAGEPSRAGARAAGRARGDPVWRRLQLAATADALGGRAGGAPEGVRDRGAARPAGGWREPLRPRRHGTAVDDARARDRSAGGAGGARS